MTSSLKRFSKQTMSTINRIMYGLFVMFGIFSLWFRHDILDAMSMFGIALIFDPFDSEVEWKKRPSYQKFWLFVHVSIVIALLVIGLAF